MEKLQMAETDNEEKPFSVINEKNEILFESEYQDYCEVFIEGYESGYEQGAADNY